MPRARRERTPHDPQGRTLNYLIEQKITFAKPRFTVRDGNDQDVYVVEGKALRVHEQLWIRDLDGTEIAFVKEQGFVKPAYEISRQGVVVARVTPKRKLLKLNFVLSDAATGAETIALGNFTGYEYDFQRGGRSVAHVKKHARWKERYSLEVRDGEDDVLFVAAVLAIDAFHQRLEERREEQRRMQQR